LEGQPAWEARGVLAGGLLVTVLLVAYLITVINHGAKTQRLAAELTTVNEGLKTEVTERKRLEEAERSWANESSVMAEIGRVISSSLEINEVYESLGEDIRKLIPFDQLDMSLINYKGATTSPTWAPASKARPGPSIPLPRLPRDLQHRQGCHCPTLGRGKEGSRLLGMPRQQAGY